MGIQCEALDLDIEIWPYMNVEDAATDELMCNDPATDECIAIGCTIIQSPHATFDD